ncbi:TPA: hypothetical protein N0F65_009186 [Lagenidium giganteum]|uniref:Uncharacterized protein n=1 Tax=Lagenidium giganteum TaxID=4803 RepID=A0AAV2YNY5_9STRA|nr:TPA: hypothetical protein N0F65_009186 [Lagenidium giganteum]
MANDTFTPGNVAEAYEKTLPTPKDDASAPSKQGCSPRTIGNTCIGLGVFFVVCGIIYGTVVPPAINKQIKSGVAMCSASDFSKDAYLDPYGDCKDCVPYYFKLTMFNATNAQEHLEKGVPLKLQEVGPYAYCRREKKVDVSFNKPYVTYSKYSYHTFDQSKSCKTCKESDVVVNYDVGYLNVITQAGGEIGFLRQLIGGTFGATKTPDEIDDMIKNNGTQIMRFINGLNSMNPEAMLKLQASILGFLTTGPLALTTLDLSGFAYNGLFVSHKVSEWAQGYPSFLAGMALGSHNAKVCKKLGDKCKTCEGEECARIFADCNKCVLAAKVVAANNATCNRVAAIVAEGSDEAKGAAFAAATCNLPKMCETLGLCVAPLPGVVETSGQDFSKEAPPSEILGKYIQNTGCDDLSQINVYKQYDGYTSAPLWVKIDGRRNPTIKEMNEFAAYGNCKNPTENLTCPEVKGNDATAIKPALISISGFASEPSSNINDMYLSQAKQNVTLEYHGSKNKETENIPLVRFAPPSDLLHSHPWNEARGTGYPVDGVQPLAFSTGFLAYLSYPVFLWGDKALYNDIEITMIDGVKATQETLFENGELKKPYAEKYTTFVDVEPGVGKAMNARKRLMASYAVAASVAEKNSSMSEVVWPKLKPEIIVPSYWGEESSSIPKDKADHFHFVHTITKSLLPTMIAGIVVGLGLVAGGVVYRRRASAVAKNEA